MSSKNSQVPPVRYKLSQSPGERAKLVLVNEASGLGPRPLFKEVARGRGVVRGHRQERSDVLPLRDVENLQLNQVSHEKQRSLSSNPGRQRSMVAQEIYSRPRDARSAETLQPAVLQAISYESPRKASIGEPSERLGDRIMARKNSRDETPVMIRKSSRDDTLSMRKGSRDEAVASSRNQVADDTPESLRDTPRLQLTTVPEVRDESIMERGRPVSRRDSKRGHSTDPFSGNLSPRSHSAAPNYTLPQTCYAPSEPSAQPSPSKYSGPTRPLLHSSVSTPSVPRLPSIQQSLSAPNTARPTFHSTHSTPSTSTRPSLQSSPWIPDHPRKDSLDPIAFRTDPAFRILRALREIDKSCLRLFDDCEALQQERSTLHTEMMSVISNKSFNSAHLEIIRQQQQDLVDMDAKIELCMHNIMERQRRKTKLVDGLPEVQEMDKAEELKQRLAAREAEAGGMGTPVRAASPWGPRESSLKTSVQVNGLLSPPPTSKTQQRGTVTYSAIMDFLDEFD
ncbi:hypothetical protein E4T43_05725 [Aureobasidium subglaciale]|nr:hypothetical protein E4T43_05725 [Aureobasidium subglaciale]